MTRTQHGCRDAIRFFGGYATGAVPGDAATATTQEDISGWFSDVSNFEEVVDRTGQDSVTVSVGSEANGGAFGFSPPAVRVDPGTAVEWE
jgi:plastocyanin